MKITTDEKFLSTATNLVSDYVNEHLDRSDTKPVYKVYVV